MRPRPLLALAASALLAGSLVACSSSVDPASGAGDGTFPVVIEHAFGETTIPEQPERVVTVAWANHEVPIALGVVPVGMSAATWGDDDGDGVLPWVEDALDELGAETPVLFDETDGFDYEAIADLAPDVILASYSGLTEEEYETLSAIAPTVAFPEIAWGTTMTQMIEMNAAALGLAEEGEALVADLASDAAAAFDEFPALAGTSVVFAYLDPNDLSQIGFYTDHDTRPAWLYAAGMTEPAAIADASAETDAFYTSVSAEQGDLFADVDVFITYGDDSTVELLKADPLLGQIPAIAAGRVAVLPESTPLAASANPSPLSIGWLPEFYAVLADALT